MKILLINSNQPNPFSALYYEKGIYTTYATDIINNKGVKINNRNHDKLFHCYYQIAKKAKEEGIDLNNLDAISVIIGPGSFTSIRVGISIAKGAAFGLSKKIIPITNFEVVINRVKNKTKLTKYCVLYPAKSPEFYFAIVENQKEILKGCSNINEILCKFSNIVLVGNFADEFQAKLNYLDILNVKNLKSELDSMIELSVENYKMGRLFHPYEIEPLYIKDFYIKN